MKMQGGELSKNTMENRIPSFVSLLVINFIPVLAAIEGGGGGRKDGMFLQEVVLCKAE